MKAWFCRFCILKSSWLTSKRSVSSGISFNVPQISYRSSTADEPLVGWTLGNVIDRSAQIYGDREAVVVCHQNIRKNFVQLKSDADKLAAGFLALDLKRGDRIGVWSTNNYEYVLTQLAAAKAGLILVSINAAYRANELEYCLNKVQTKALVFDDIFKRQDYYGMLKTLIPNLPESKEINSNRIPSLKKAISISPKELGGTYRFDDVLNAAGSKEMNLLEELQHQIQFDDPATIVFTSGTTGKPKGATLSHHNIVNNAYIVARKTDLFDTVLRLCLPLPLFHVFSSVTGAINYLISGNCVIYPSRTFNAIDTLKAIQEERATSLYGTTTMFIDILQFPTFKTFDLSSLKAVGVGGTGCPETVLLEMKEKLASEQSRIGYGATETTSSIAFHSRTNSQDLQRTTIGQVLPHTEIKIVDENNRIVPIGTTGEMCVRGYQVMLGYWDEPEKTKEVITADKWYKTGDLATIDENGFIKIDGRIKDMLIRGGENIYPKEIEEFLHTHSKIAEVQVVGVPDKRMGEEVCAWVKMVPGEKLSEEDIIAFCKDNLATYKIPRYIIFVDEFPKTPIGKVQKFKMREESIKILNLAT